MGVWISLHINSERGKLVLGNTISFSIDKQYRRLSRKDFVVKL